MIFTVHAGRIDLDGRSAPCALGRAGVRAAADKREGDGATPLGVWPLRRLLYRADRAPAPRTRLATLPIGRADGWCDDPLDPAYNRPVRLPYRASAETMWRDDALYELVVVLGYNDDPPVAGRGSAIFLHLARADYAPTEGCIALARPDLAELLGVAGPGDALAVVEA